MSHKELIKEEKNDSLSHLSIVWWISINMSLFSLHLEPNLPNNQSRSVMVYDNRSSSVHISNCWDSNKGIAHTYLLENSNSCYVAFFNAVCCTIYVFFDRLDFASYGGYLLSIVLSLIQIL